MLPTTQDIISQFICKKVIILCIITLWLTLISSPTVASNSSDAPCFSSNVLQGTNKNKFGIKSILLAKTCCRIITFDCH